MSEGNLQDLTFLTLGGSKISFNEAASSASGGLYVVGFARQWAHTED